MPQMFPLNWLILYLYFSLFFILLIINNYFSSNMFFKSKNTSFLKTKKFNWKW